MLIPISFKYSVAEVVGCIKGTSDIAVARQFGNKKKNFNREFWACGHTVSIVVFEKAHIASYIKNQEQLDGHGANNIGDF